MILRFKNKVDKLKRFIYLLINFFKSHPELKLNQIVGINDFKNPPRLHLFWEF